MNGEETSPETLKFEYEQLQEEVFHNNNVAHGIMGILVGASVVVLGLVGQQKEISPTILFGAFIVSFSTIVVWYGVSQHLNYSNYMRIARMLMIERKLGMFSHRIFDENGEEGKLPDDLKKEIERISKKGEGRFAHIRMKDYFTYYVLIYLFVWLGILYSYFWIRFSSN